MSPLLLPITCILAVSEIALEPTESGWIETGHHEIIAESRCPWVDVLLPAGSSISDLKARVHLSDGGRRKVDAPRQQVVLPTAREPERLRLLTPDLLAGDSVHIELTRQLPALPYTWTPGSNRGRFASLDSALPFLIDGQERRSWWLEDADDEEVEIPHPSPATPEPARALPSPISHAVLHQTLLIPGDPQRSLYPGGGSKLQTRWSFTTPAQDAPTSLVVPVPLGAQNLQVEGEHRRGYASITLLIPEGLPTTHSVSFRTDDAPTHGSKAVLPGAEVLHEISVDDGRIRWEDERFWYLSSVGMQPLTPDPRRMIRALDQRFRRASLPEPAVPVPLRGMEPSEQLASTLRTTLQMRAGVGPLSVDPLFPRRLRKARKSGAITSVEAALILALQLGQLDARATWGIVAPTDPSLASMSTPVGYTEGVVVLATASGPAFIDPGCTVCAGFEIRPHLQGARMLSPAGIHGPSYVVGSAKITDANGERSVELVGPPALELRLALAEQPRDQRTTWLTNTFGGEGSTFVSAKGLGKPGLPIEIVLSLSDSPPDARFLFPPTWVGDRIWIHPGSGSPRHEHADELCFTRRQLDEHTQQTLLTVNARTPAASWNDFQEQVRRPNPATPDEPAAPAP